MGRSNCKGNTDITMKLTPNFFCDSSVEPWLTDEGW